MYRPAGYSSDEDEYANFLSEDEDAVITNRFGNINTEESTKKLDENKIFMGILYGQINTVIDILDSGFDVNAQLKDNWTPLLLAASVGEPDIAMELIKRGADVNKHKDFYTPLMAAASCPESTSSFDRSLEVATQLITSGAEIDAKTRKRMTALMYAASNGHVGLIKTLLPKCDKIAQDNQGWTALFWAVNDNKLKAFEMLMEAGLDYNKVDVRGNIPLHYALSNSCEEIINLLPDQRRKRKSFLEDSVYSFDELFQDNKPKFFRDVCLMLYGMKNERNMELFLENDVDLPKFLTLTDDDLQHLGVNMPYERYRIKCGLYRFHKHLYKAKSIPIVSKNDSYSTFDVANSIVAACRQFVTMEASLRYLVQNITNVEDLRSFRSEIENMKRRIHRIKNTALVIHSNAKLWDLENQPADLIDKKSRIYIKKRKFTWMYTIGVLSIITYFTIVRIYH